MQFRSRQRRGLNLELNIINLIDVLVVIIVFLMVTTYGTLTGALPVRLPTAVTGEAASSQTPVVISVTADGQVYVSGQAVSEAELTEGVRQALAQHQELPVIIQADQELRYATVVHVMSLAKGAGAQRLILATAAAPTEGPPPASGGARPPPRP
jgi:biopolymer transport protein ExbD